MQIKSQERFLGKIRSWGDVLGSDGLLDKLMHVILTFDDAEAGTCIVAVQSLDELKEALRQLQHETELLVAEAVPLAGCSCPGKPWILAGPSGQARVHQPLSNQHTQESHGWLTRP